MVQAKQICKTPRWPSQKSSIFTYALFYKNFSPRLTKVGFTISSYPEAVTFWGGEHCSEDRKGCGNVGCSGEEWQQLHGCAREGTVHWRHKQNEERRWKRVLGLIWGKWWSAKGVSFQNEEGFDAQMMQKQVNILQGAKGRGRQGRKFYPSCTGDDMLQLVRQSVTTAPWSIWGYKLLSTVWWLTITSSPTLTYKFKTSFQARAVIRQEGHPGSVFIRSIPAPILHKNSGHSTVLIL